MKLREFPLLTDENVDPDVVAGLHRLGFDVLDVIESGRAGANDVDLLRWATSQGRVVVSHDAAFGTQRLSPALLRSLRTAWPTRLESPWRPKPADADRDGAWYTFERSVPKTDGENGWADVWMRSAIL